MKHLDNILLDLVINKKIKEIREESQRPFLQLDINQINEENYKNYLKIKDKKNENKGVLIIDI